MSASEAAALYPARAGKPPGEGRSLLALVERVTPKQGWDSFLLLFGIVGVVALTMRQAEWVETPGLIPIVAWSCLAGLVFAKTRGPWPLLFVAGLAVGFVVVIWQASSLVEGQTLADRTGELWTRLGARYEAATTGGISVDLLPFTLGVLSLAWLLGFLSAWLLFRVTHIWLGLVLAGTAMLTNLSFLPSGNEPRFFLFMLFAMLLVARVSALQRQDQWRSTRFRTASISRSVAIPAAAGISVVVLIIASGLPLNVYVSYAAARLWNQARSPVASMEHEFARLFSGIPSRKDLSGRFFGKTLPFQGKISPGSDVVLLANSNHPSYWLSRTYSQYTSEGWIAGETESLRVGPESLPPPRQESFKREAVFQRLQPTFDTVTVLSGGNVDWINREAVVETLAPLEFEVDLRDLSNNSHLPEDIQGLATELKRVSSPPPAGFVESHIYKMIPLDLVLTGVFPRGDDATGTAPEKITLARKQPNLPDVVSWRLVETLKADYYYSMRTFVSRATDDDLRAAGTKYSGFIKDHYLQLPTTLPQRVRDLAIALTQSAETPLDKTLVVQDLLRGSNFEYSQDIDKPPRGADGVDHFLFETRTGYSDYFASSMAVLLRAAGVPARQAAGYAPGELDELGRRVVMDSDSHGWTQVYFPGHGWIDFEPTPVWPVPRRGGFTENESGSDSNNGLSTDSPDCLQDPDLAAFACEDGEAEIAEETDLEQLLLEAGISGGALEEAGGSPRSLTLPVALALIVVAGTPALGWFILTWGLGKATPSERAYSKMSRLGTLAGIRRQSHQTPAEYAGNIGNAIPAIASGSQELAGAFAAGRYSGREQGGGGGGGGASGFERGLEECQGWAAVPGAETANTAGASVAPMTSLYYDLFETPLGWMGLQASSKGLRRTTLPQPSPDRCLSLLELGARGIARRPEAFVGLKSTLSLYFMGAPVTFADEPVDIDDAPRFLRAAWVACRSIPVGETRTYKWLAAQAGSPQASRAAGQSMANNRLPIVIPCHRVIASDGSLRGFGEGATQLELKRQLLKLETEALKLVA